MDLTSQLDQYAWPEELRRFITVNLQNFKFDTNLLNLVSSNSKYFGLTFLSEEYLPLGYIWAASAKNADVPFAIGTVDEVSTNSMKQASIPHFRVYAPDLPNSYINKGGFNGKALGIILTRYQVVKFLLEHGINTFHCDIDALLLNDPTPDLISDVSFQRVMHFPNSTIFNWGFAACGGFISCKATPYVIELLNRILEFQTKVSSDQLAWNTVLLNHVIQWTHTLPIETDKAKLKQQFIDLAGSTFKGYSTKLQLSFSALPATNYWRHTSIPITPTQCTLLHPNAPKDLHGKLSVFSSLIKQYPGLTINNSLTKLND